MKQRTRQGLSAARLNVTDDWPEWLREELAKAHQNGCIGRQVISENARARIWRTRLEPSERIAFHCHALDYLWIALNDGKLQAREPSGRIECFEVNNGTVHYRHVPLNDRYVRDLENVGDAALSFIVVEFLDSANTPLPVPDHIRLR